MGSRPIIKDGLVVNVVEIDDDCAIMTKAECRRQEAAELADYAARVAAWRERVALMRAEVDAAREKAGIAMATMSALKARAASEKSDAKVAALFRQASGMEQEVNTLVADVRSLQERPAPAKPRLVRGKRWFYPDGVEVGPPGGNIGDLWDGKSYTRPEKDKAA